MQRSRRGRRDRSARSQPRATTRPAAPPAPGRKLAASRHFSANRLRKIECYPARPSDAPSLAMTRLVVDARLLGHSGIGTYLAEVLPRVLPALAEWRPRVIVNRDRRDEVA